MNETKFTNEYIVALAKTMTPGNAEQVIARWKMSTDEANLLRFLDERRDTIADADYYVSQVAMSNVSQAHAVNLFVMWERPADAQKLADFVLPEMPISGKDVLDLGVKPGPQVGKLLRQARLDWVGSNFFIGRQGLLRLLAEHAKEC